MTPEIPSWDDLAVRERRKYIAKASVRKWKESENIDATRSKDEAYLDMADEDYDSLGNRLARENFTSMPPASRSEYHRNGYDKEYDLLARRKADEDMNAVQSYAQLGFNMYHNPPQGSETPG